MNGLTINIWKVQFAKKKNLNSTHTELSKKKFNYRDLFVHDWLLDILFMVCYVYMQRVLHLFCCNFWLIPEHRRISFSGTARMKY